MKCVIGITDHAAGELGDIVYLDLPEARDQKSPRVSPWATIETVKAVEELFAPVSGEVVDRQRGSRGFPGNRERISIRRRVASCESNPRTISWRC